MIDTPSSANSNNERPPSHNFVLFNPARGTRYYAVVPLNQGGFGWVWSGTTAEGLPIAIKIFKPSDDFRKDFHSWFTEQEICLRCLQHQYIVTTYDQFYSPPHGFVIVMEEASGSLADVLRLAGPQRPFTICHVGCHILLALHYIHNLGVVHRDVSLNNILLFPPSLFKLADFGISRQGVGIGEYARTFIGRRSHIPPELLTAGYTTHQSDIYQLGIVLLSLLTGTMPIPDDASVETTARMIREGVPRQTAEALIPTHGRLAQILSMMLRRRAQWRYQSAEAVYTEMYALLEELLPTTQ